MDSLKVPEPLASARVERDQAVTEEILPMAIGAVEIVAGGSKWNEGDAAFFIHAHFVPVVHASPRFPKILRPRFVPELARMRHRMKHPHELAGAGVVGVDIGGYGRVVIAACRQRNDEQVLENAARVVRLQRLELIDIADRKSVV